MNTDFSKQFFKQLNKLPAAAQERFWSRLDIWRVNPAEPMLHVHRLKGKYQGFYSMNVSGDLRALYKVMDDGSVVLFDLIGSHSQLY